MDDDWLNGCAAILAYAILMIVILAVIGGLWLIGVL